MFGKVRHERIANRDLLEMAYDEWSNAAKRERKESSMKKDKAKNQKKQPRRLILNRETIRFLNDPAPLELARGGLGISNELMPSCIQTFSYESGC